MFTVCVPTVRATTLFATVDAIRRQTWQHWELIVVGQGDAPELMRAAEKIERLDSRIRYIHLAQKGASVARHTGLRAARGRWIAMTDDDCIPANDWLAVLAEYFQLDGNISLIGGPLVKPPRPHKQIGFCPNLIVAETVYDSATTPGMPPKGWDWVSANVALTHTLVDRVGLFDEQLGGGAFFPAGEDTDYKLRIEALRPKMASTPRAVVQHTYGWRLGAKATLHHVNAYSRGNGALAGKLTLLQDPRGKVWLAEEKRRLIETLTHPQQLYRLPIMTNRLIHFLKGYHDCLRLYCIDPHTKLLQPLLSAVPSPSL